MNSNPIRRAQLIAPFGVGSLYTGPNGVATIAAGLDHWYRKNDGTYDDVELDEFQVEEWRLKRILGVGQLRLPPDYREPFGFGNDDAKNMLLSVPQLRFPTWHFCPRSSCRALVQRPQTATGSQWCQVCERKGNRSKLAQVRFIALCPDGHVQDFPWREWVHRSSQPRCDGNLRLVSTGGASLASQRVECDCGVKPRNLTGITLASTDATPETSHVSSNLDPSGVYLCRGIRPWLGDLRGEGCDRPIRGSLRSGINVYYAHVESSIYVPRSDTRIDPTLDGLLRQPPLSTWIQTASDLGVFPTVERIRGSTHGNLLVPFADADLAEGLQIVTEEADALVELDDTAMPEDHLTQQRIRRPEHEKLRNSSKHPELTVRKIEISMYDEPVASALYRVNLVDVVRETRALYGFSRVMPAVRTYREHRDKLWLNQPSEYAQNWLPAYEVRGEGIYFELEESRVAEWEIGYAASRHAALQRNADRARSRRGQDPQTLLPRYVLLHSLAHILINRLVFECGYSSASLRERLYVAAGENPMTGLLIYTAAGDSEGTLGGLVRMGEPGMFEPVLAASLAAASWCSADPVCMELGTAGQGPESCNLAACHSCCLLPETSCESFNKYLDRAALIGTHEDPTIGFFSSQSAEP